MSCPRVLKSLWATETPPKYVRKTRKTKSYAGISLNVSYLNMQNMSTVRKGYINCALAMLNGHFTVSVFPPPSGVGSSIISSQTSPNSPSAQLTTLKIGMGATRYGRYSWSERNTWMQNLTVTAQAPSLWGAGGLTPSATEVPLCFSCNQFYLNIYSTAEIHHSSHASMISM